MARSTGGWIQRIGLVVVVGAIVVAFVLVFGQPGGGGGVPIVAQVRGERITQDLYATVWSQFADIRRSSLPPDAGDELVTPWVDERTLSHLVQTYLLAQEARALGLRISDEELREQICASPSLPRCDPESFAAHVRSLRYPSERAYTDLVRRELLVAKLRRLLEASIRISDTAVEERLRRDRLSLRLRYAVARAESFRDDVAVDEAEAAALAEAEPGRVEAEYNRRAAEFRQPERVRARHILFSGDDARERAEAARARLDAGEDFVVLAAELSDDTATRDNGGELGFFPRGRMLAEFDEAVFAAEARSLIGPVETPRGFHLIRVEERQPAVEQTLEDVEALLAWDLLRDERTREVAREAAERMASLLGEGSEFGAAAEEAGLQLDETIHFRPADPLVPGIGRIPGLAETASRLTPEEPVSRLVFGSEDVFYLISLADRVELDPDTLATALEPVRERMRLEARSLLIDALYRTSRAALEASGELQTYPPAGS